VDDSGKISIEESDQVHSDFRPDLCETNCRGLGEVDLFRDPDPTARRLTPGTGSLCGICPGSLYFNQTYDLIVPDP